MRRFKRSEIQETYKQYVDHLKEVHPLEYEQHEKYLSRYAL